MLPCTPLVVFDMMTRQQILKVLSHSIEVRFICIKIENPQSSHTPVKSDGLTAVFLFFFWD